MTMSGRILCLTKYNPDGPSSRYRFFQYLPWLRESGWDIQTHPLFPPGYIEDLYGGRRWSASRLLSAYMGRIRDLFSAGSFDLVWIEYELLPWLPGFAEAWLRMIRIPYVVDYDDAIFHRYDQHAFKSIRWTLGRKIDRVMAGASAVTTGNRYLAARASAAGASRIEIIPTVVDQNLYPSPNTKKHWDEFRIGWIGSPSTQGYLAQIAPELAAICRNGQGRLVVIGAKADFSLPGVPIDHRIWSSATEARELQQLDVGIMPLPAENPWAKGKCGFKLIQYMASGLPVVATAVDTNRDIVIEGETGFLAAKSEDWTRSLNFLKGNAAICRTMGENGRRRMEDHFSLQSQRQRLSDLFGDLVPSR